MDHQINLNTTIIFSLPSDPLGFSLSPVLRGFVGRAYVIFTNCKKVKTNKSITLFASMICWYHCFGLKNGTPSHFYCSI